MTTESTTTLSSRGFHVDPSNDFGLKIVIISGVFIGVTALVTGILALSVAREVEAFMHFSCLGAINSAAIAFAGLVLFVVSIIAWVLYHRETSSQEKSTS